MIIELHLLQSFPPSNLNRDENGMPKDCEFGGYRRARISSQCLKRSIRFSKPFQDRMDYQIGYRTRNVLDNFVDELVKLKIEKDKAEVIAREVIEIIIGKIDKQDKTSALFYTDSKELRNLAIVTKGYLDKIMPLLEEVDEKKKQKSNKDNLKAISKSIAKDFFDLHSNKIDSVDIALFGRMLANTPSMKIDAACQVAHAISTNRITMEFDYFTAVDDLNPEGEGAGMIGSSAFNSACYYRYSAIDADQLMFNLGDKKELAVQGILAFIESSVLALPTGKKNVFAHNTQPEFIMIVARESNMASNLVNAFERPAYASNNNSLTENSVIRIDEHWKYLNEMYDFDNGFVGIVVKRQDLLKNLAEEAKVIGSLKDVLLETEIHLNQSISDTEDR
jgi:CRISPR system Cascade subunit CasC